MSFSFRKLFKKSEQDPGVERTRLQFGRPQDQDVSSNEHNDSFADVEGLTAEGVFASSAPSPEQGIPPRVSEDSTEVQSPFQIVDSVSATPDSSGPSQRQPFPSNETAFSSDGEVSGEGGALVPAENSGLFDEAPKPAIEPVGVGFYESVMENGGEGPEEKPDSLFSGVSPQDKSSPLQDPALTSQIDSHEAIVSGDLDPVAGSRELPWLDDPEKEREGATPSSVASSDSIAEGHEELTQNPVGEVEVGCNADPEGGASFFTTESVPDALESGTEDNGMNSPFGSGALSAPESSYSSRIPDGSEQPSGFPPPSAEAETPEDIATSEHFPSFLEKDDPAEEEGLAPGRDFPAFPPPSDQDNIMGEGQSAGNNLEPLGFPDLSAKDKQAKDKESCTDHFDPEPQSLPNDPPSGLEKKGALAEAGPWPLEGGFPPLKANMKSPEPLESLSPLAAGSTDASGFSAPEGEPAPDQHAIQSANASHASKTGGQATLRALLMTDAEIDGEMVVRHCADLEGVHLCVACTTDARIKASSMPGGTFEIDVMGLLGSVRTLAEALGSGLEGPLTMHSAEGIVSFFVSANAGVGVLHAEGALESGAQEHLWLITGALNAECK